MRAWIIRFASLYVFDVVVLLLIGGFTPGVRVGWSALWASLILTAATLWLKPLVHGWFRSLASRSAAGRSRIREKLVQYGLVLTVAALIWVLLIVLRGVHVGGFFFLWGWIAPPVALTIAWGIYDLLDDRIEARAGALYDRATGGRRAADTTASGATPPIPPASAYPGGTTRPRRDDGLTDEQRRMLDEL